MKTLFRMSIIAAVLMGGAAGAHHSAAPFDQTKVVMLSEEEAQDCCIEGQAPHGLPPGLTCKGEQGRRGD